MDCPKGDALTKLCGETAQLVRKCCQTARYQQYNITPSLRHLGSGQYPHLEALTRAMTVPELADFARFLKDVDGRLTSSEKKRRIGYPF